jgi:hypothetical protein
VTFGGRNVPHLDDGLGDTCTAIVPFSYPYSYYPLTCSTPAVSPPPRWGTSGAATTDGSNGNFGFVIYGGSSSLAAGGARADSWWWDPYTGWSALCGVSGKPACAPGVAVQSVLDYDDLTKQLYMVSSSGSELITSAFDIASQTWSVLCGGTMPSCGVPHRLNYGFAFDRGRHRGILAGGGDETVHVFDTWEMVVRGNDCALGCDTGICTDGVCCDQPTCGTCQACNLPGSLGSCGAVKSGDDTDSCPVLTSTCDATGACRARGGQSCGADAACASGHCVSAGGGVSVCCNVASCPSGQICQIGKGTCIGDLGYVCTKDADCASGHCADGVCCDSACDPSKPCQSCANPGNPGHCAATTGAPTAGRAACPKSASSDASCNQSVCNGSDMSACHYPGSTTTCASGAKCASGVESDPAGCDGAGACATTTKPCNAYACGASACKTTCSTESDCAAGYWCSGGACTPKTGLGSPCTTSPQCASGLFCTDGVCCGSASCPSGTCNGSKPGTCTLSLGQTCSAGSQCASGTCVDGVCCNTACGGVCEACNVAGSLGVCTPVVGSPASGHGSCNAGTGPGDCAATTCNGSTRSACAYVSGNACGAGCAGASTATTAGTCDGTGKCVGSATVQCAPYVCASSACKTTCASSADCTAGNYCDATGHCVALLGNGTTCGGDAQCQSGHCVDGVCCASGSCPSGGSCNDPSNLGICSIKLGQPVVAGVPCASKGVAADGVCCNSACTGLCESCNVAGLAGVCSPIPNGGQPAATHGTCPSSGTDATCKQSYCDGVQRGQCKYPDGKVACGSASCVAGSYVSGGVCSGGGACVPTTSGGCAPYVCGATACKTTCGGDADCSAGAFCDATGHCAYKANVGNPCATDAACGAGLWCTNNICCTAQTCGTGDCVNRGTEKGVCKAGNGASCSIDGDCVSSHCVDGVCCNTACTEQCGSCKVAGFEGVCTPVIGAPTGGRPPCAGDGTTCGSKTCTGASLSCVDPPTSTPCGAQACDGATNTELDPGFCGAGGKCSMTSRPCGYFLCAGTACKTKCTADADCVSTAFCAADGTCQLKGALGQPCDPKLVGACGTSGGKTLGCQNGVCCDDPQCEAHGGFCGGTHPGVCLARNNQACGADGECSSGHCADKDATSGKGVCCDTACDGVCESCTTTGTPGTCAPIAGAPAKGHGACAAGTGDACSGSVCDGTDGKSCAGKPGAETVCQAASCVAGKANPPITCNGSGSCPTVTPVYCDNFRTCLDAKSCNQGPCKADADCADGYTCDAATGKCREKAAHCKDGDPTIAIDVAGNEVPCAPYLCDTNGTCKQSCTGSTDCAGGYVCDTSIGQCTTPGATGSTDSGGCDASGGGGTGESGHGGGVGIGVAGVAIAIGALRRRRRAA